jgi:hypothetical protein
MNRGHETTSHRLLKGHVADVLLLRGWIVRFEAGNADVVAYRPGHAGIWSIECERTAKWVIRNITRDVANGVGGVVVVVPSSGMASAILKRIALLPPGLLEKVAVVTVSQFNESYVEAIMEKE